MSRLGTAYPIWSDTFRRCFQSSKQKLVGLFSLKRGIRDLRASTSSFWENFQNVNSNGIGCIYISNYIVLMSKIDWGWRWPIRCCNCAGLCLQKSFMICDYFFRRRPASSAILWFVATLKLRYLTAWTQWYSDLLMYTNTAL